MAKKWVHGVVKEKIYFFDVGDEVLMVESTIEHAHPNMGTSHWVMSRDGSRILLINDYAFGANLRQLVRIVKPVEADKQARCTRRAKELLINSVYTPSNRKKHTYFFGGRHSN